MPYKDPKDERLRAARRKHYRNNKEQYLKNNRVNRKRIREELSDIKEARGCADCDGRFPGYVLDFHHKDPNNKSLQ